MKRVAIAGILAASVCTTGVANASEKPGQWYVAPMASVIWVDDSRGADDDVGAALGFGRAISEDWNVELHSFGYSLSGFNDTDMWGVGLDMMRVYYRTRRISPYLSIGGGFNQKNRAFGEDEKNSYANAAFGFLTDFVAGGGVSLRTELRYRLDFESPTEQDLMANVGLQIPFGSPYAQPAPEPRAAPADTDGDGVPDDRDQCPGTPAGVEVDADGCPLDSDGDGVPDHRDQCPDTPSGTPVNAEGCPLDSDGDGVTDDRDRCPDTRPGVRVDVNGCEITAVIRLRGVEFAHDSERLTPSSKQTLDDAAATLQKHEDLRVEVAGHTDSSGTDSYNQQLSERRARAVLEYLASAGVDRQRMTSRGYGEAEPEADNSTPEGRAENRRVELRIQE
jgi:OOP family OmpA-OmpF porin